MLLLRKFLIFSAIIDICQSWPGFQVLTERTEVTHNDKRYIEVWMKTGRSNRTTITTNTTVHIYQTISKTAVVRVVGYEFKSNEYRRSAIDISKYLCDFYNGEYKMFFQKTMEKCGGHLPESCPLKKGYYYWYNFVMEAMYIPFKPIGDRWMFEGNLSLDENLLTRILWYINIERNAEFWSH